METFDVTNSSEYKETDSDIFVISYSYPINLEVLKEGYMLASGQSAINI